MVSLLAMGVITRRFFRFEEPFSKVEDNFSIFVVLNYTNKSMGY